MPLKILYEEANAKRKELEITRRGSKFFYIINEKETEIAQKEIWSFILELRRSHNVLTMTGNYL